MKTRRSFSPLAYSAAAVVWMSATFGVGNVRAGGPAGGAVGIGAAASATGGGHAAVSSVGSAHASAPAVSHGASVSHVGVSPGYNATANLHPITATYAGPPRYLPGGFTPNTVSRGPNFGVANNRPAAAAPANAFAGRVTTPAGTTAQARNAWTDPAADGRNNNQRTGQFLYPNAPRDVLGDHGSSGHGYAGSSYNGLPRFRFNRRGYYDPFVYGYPGVFVGGYAPYSYGYGDGLGTADLNGDLTGNAPNTVADSNAVSPATQEDLSRPYPSAQYSLTPAPEDPATIPRVPAANPGAPLGNGPDSLVEAVQAELSRRGYFGGKIDATYNDATHAAIQRFQQDQKLPASGRINEATLHALELD